MGQKGGQYERDLCRQLSNWWTNGKHSDVFWRTSQSGGRATTRAKSGQRTRGQEGDIAATHPSGLPFTRLFTIESKRGYPKHNPMFMIAPSKREGKKGFAEFIVQAKNAAGRAQTPFWLIIHRWDQRGAVVYFPYRLRTNYGFDGQWIFPSAQFSFQSYGKIICLRLEDFFLAFTPDRLRQLEKELRRA